MNFSVDPRLNLIWSHSIGEPDMREKKRRAHKWCTPVDPSHRRAKARQPARTYIQLLCANMGCSPEDLPETMDYREEWRKRVGDIRADSATWWWYWSGYPCLKITVSYKLNSQRTRQSNLFLTRCLILPTFLKATLA